MKKANQPMKPLKSHEVNQREAKWYEFLITQEEKRAAGVLESKLKNDFRFKLMIKPVLIPSLLIAIASLNGWIPLGLDDFTVIVLILLGFILAIFFSRREFIYYNKAFQRYQEETQLVEKTYSAKDINGLAMHPPEDSRVKFDLLSGGQLIDSVRVSHYTASFVYFLGLERNAGEEYWLSSPDKHLDVLEKIFIDLDLDEIFEEELKLTSPPSLKNRKTWIWGFGTDKRRDTRNKIQGQITNLKTVSNFELIVNIKKPIIENRLANYQLNKNIKSFTVEPPNN
jgi:hypothetical protein